MPEQPYKTSKTGHFGVLLSKSSDYRLNCEKKTQSDCKEIEKRITKYRCVQSLLLMTIFFLNEYLSEPIGKDRKISQYSVILFWNRSRDCSNYTPAYDSTGVPAHLISVLPDRSGRRKKRTAKSSLPLE